MTTSISENISNYPCVVCMGFCLENSNCIQCDRCLNWFHYECVNLSYKKFSILANDSTLEFICTICSHNKECESCGIKPSENNKILYCATCLKHYCNKCNPVTLSLMKNCSFTTTLTSLTIVYNVLLNILVESVLNNALMMLFMNLSSHVPIVSIGYICPAQN